MYTDLVKLFYSNKADYKTELEARINNPQAKRLDFYIGGNRAFYLPLPELFESAGKIWRADKYIYAITNGLPGVALRQFIVRSLVDEIELTNGIEGVFSSRREINDIIVDLRDDWEMRAHKMKHSDGTFDLLSVVAATDFLASMTLLAQVKGKRTLTVKRKDVLSLSLDDYKAYADDLTDGYIKAARLFRSARMISIHSLRSVQRRSLNSSAKRWVNVSQTLTALM